MKQKLIIAGVLVAVVLVLLYVRSRPAADSLGDLNSPENMAKDECLAAAQVPLQKVFLEACFADRGIDANKDNCSRWSSKAILTFMQKSPNYPTFKEALAAWELETQKCSAN